MMRILRTWECNIEREIEKFKQRLSILDGLSTSRSAVLKIIQDVRKRGDKALVSYSKQFDRVSLSPDNFRVRESEIEDAYKRISLPL